MPNLIKAYGCSFKCGKKVLTSKTVMTRHEKHCKKNPALKTCATCIYDDYPLCSAGVLKSKPMIRDCSSWQNNEAFS